MNPLEQGALFIIGCHILQALQSGSPFFSGRDGLGLHSYITQLIVDIFRNGRINKKDAQLVFTTHDVNLLDQNTIRKDLRSGLRRKTSSAYRKCSHFRTLMMGGKIPYLPNGI